MNKFKYIIWILRVPYYVNLGPLGQYNECMLEHVGRK